MLTDRYGLAVSTASAAARDAYVAGTDLLLSANYGPDAEFQRAIDADPTFVLAHLGKARTLQMQGKIAEARAALADAETAGGDLTARESSQLSCFRLLIDGRNDAALLAAQRHLAEFPRDAMVLAPCTTPLGLFGLSGRARRDHEQVAQMNLLADAYGDDWWFTGMHAFAMLEVGDVEAARRKIERSLAQQPRFAHGAHVLAHVHYEAGEVDAALAYLRGWIKDYRKGAQLHRHLNWHSALFELQTGNADTAWRLFYENVHPQSSPGPAFSIINDGISFLWRAELAGQPGDSAAWRAIREVGHAAFPRAGTAYADAHLALADAVAGDTEAVEARIAAIEALNAEAPLHCRPLVAGLARGFIAFAHGNWNGAIEALEPALAGHESLGGSRAQRDLIEFTLLKAYLNAQRTVDAQRYLAWRRAGAVAPPVAGLLH
jgi:tetratricopeptide (TPR) repeat protein